MRLRTPLDIAVVGMACRFPGAEDLVAFWECLRARRPAHGEGGNGDAESAPELGIELPHATVRAALADAGLVGGVPLGCRVEFVIGRADERDRDRLLRRLTEAIVAQTVATLRSRQPPQSEADFEAVRADLQRSLSRFGQGGDSDQIAATGGVDLSRATFIDGASASSLAALDRGSRALVERRADLAVVGDTAMVVLKRLADAERDGDRVYAVVRGIGLANGPKRALRLACRHAGLEPATIGWVADPALGGSAVPRVGAGSGMSGIIEAALVLHHRMLPSAARDPGARSPSQGASRPWIHGGLGHPRRAGIHACGFAGISAHAVLEEHSASADGETPGCQLHWESEAILLGAPDRSAWLDLARALLDWLERRPDAALKDLAHTLNTGVPTYPFRVGLVASSLTDLKGRLKGVVDRLADRSCSSVRDARGAYFWAEPLGAAGTGALAFLFPGEGSQYPGMLGELCAHFPEVRAQFDTADRIARSQGHARLPSALLFEDAGGDTAGLWSMESAITVVLSAERALHQLLTRLGITPGAVVGHSSGEFLALAAAGTMLVDEALENRLGRLGTLFERLESAGLVPAATLVAAAADRARVEAACTGLGDDLLIVIDNCPHQVVLAGPDREIGEVVRRLGAGGILCETLPFARAYHSPRFQPAIAPVREFFADVDLQPPRIALYSCAIAGRMPADPATIRRLAVDQWTLPVRFRPTIEAMYADGVRLFVEVGARGILTGFVADTLRDRPAFAVAANLPKRPALLQLNHLVASLWAHGVDLRPEFLYARRRPVRLDLSVVSRTEAPLIVAAAVPERPISEQSVLSLRSRPAANGAAHASGPRQSADGEPAAHGIAALGHDPAALAGNGDVAMLGYLRTMDVFLATQRQVMDAYLTRSTAAATAAIAQAGSSQGEHLSGPSTWGDVVGGPDRPVLRDSAAHTASIGPWVGTIRSLVPGRELVSERVLDMRDDPIAEHHTLGGRRVSALDPRRKGLPVVPFAVMAEMLAQAAAVLVPGQVLFALRDLQAHRWIRYEEEPVTLEIRAERESDEVRVAIYNRGSSPDRHDGEDGPVVVGRAIFGRSRPDPPVVAPFVLEDAGRCRFTARELYRDQWLFHGPALQALVHVGPSSQTGITGTLRVLPHRPLFRESEQPVLLMDLIIIDAFTHLLGCWALDQMSEGDVMFPLRLAELTFHGADAAEGTEVSCRIRIRELQRHCVRADVEIVGPGDRLWMRIEGWEDWRFYWPGRYRDQFRAPDRFFVGEALELPQVSAGQAGSLCAVWLEPPADMGRPVWRDVLEWVQLGPGERVALQSLPGPESRRTLRLWGRIAAKEAARRLAIDRGGSPVYPADLAVEATSEGRPRLRSLAEPERDDLPAVSIAHTEGVAVALAAFDSEAAVGIDVERIVERGAGFEAVAFSASERDLLDRLDGSGRAEWIARFWCAKEAVAKAMGCGLTAGPASVVIVAAEPATGEITAILGPALASACADWGEARVGVVTARRGDYAWAWTVAQRTTE